MHIYFGLGSNLGNRLQNLRDAAERLRVFGRIIKCSDVYETSAWGGVEQPDYSNACMSIESHNESPLVILNRIKTFERELGRVESVRWGARKIDIDILLIDDLILHSDVLDVPHIRIPERLFVLVPLSDILPSEWLHPENHMSIHEMIEGLKSEGEYALRVTCLL